MKSSHRSFDAAIGVVGVFSLLGFGCNGGGGGGGGDRAATLVGPSHSSTIAITSDDRRVVVANRETNSVAVVQVRDEHGADVARTVAEIPVGQEPRSVAITPDDRLAFVSNAVSGTVSAVALEGEHLYHVVAEIPVGTEPRGVAITPNGHQLFVANHTDGTVSVVDVASLSVIDTIPLGGNPFAIAVSNDGDDRDDDETVYVSQFYAELIPGGPGEGFDEGKQGVVFAFDVARSSAPVRMTLSPIGNVGFDADRSAFCPQFNSNLHSSIFCPDESVTDATSPVIVHDPQGAFPNQLQSLVLRNGLLYVPSIGAEPEPPVKFNVNVQALVQVVDATLRAERTDLAVNLNSQIRTETPPANPTENPAGLFANDVVAIDANRAGTDFLVVSRGGNFVLRAGAAPNGALDLHAPNVVRFQTGNIPNGVVISGDGRRAYVDNEVGVSMTAIDLETNAVLARDVPTGTVPQPGSFQHSVLVGKLAFFTALGIPDDGFSGTDVRDIVPLANRGKASANGWSSCASCHPDGLSDGVTWIFGTGPRQTLPLDAFFAKDNPRDQRISNWSAVMGSITDFNNNARGVQGGVGFAGNPPNPSIYQHGITQGASESLDAMTLWVQTVRPLRMPQPADVAALAHGREVFAANCASCHGGAKWTMSQVVYRDDPAFDRDPGAGGLPVDPGVANAGAQIRSVTVGGNTLSLLRDAGTFDAAAPLEIRGQPPTAGQTALGAIGFNVPSLLDVGFHAPYLHDGSAPTIGDVFPRHRLGGSTIAGSLSAGELADLESFLKSIDGRTPPMRSSTNDFLDAIGG